MTTQISQYAIVVNSSPQPLTVMLSFNLTNKTVIEHETKSPDAIPRSYYCGFCSGLLITNGAGLPQCLHCQTLYPDLGLVIISQTLPSISFLEKSCGKKEAESFPPILPPLVINYLRQKKLIVFDHNHLMKTLKKENYRRLYVHFKSYNDHAEPHLMELMTRLDVIFNSGRFTDADLKQLNDKYNRTLTFYIDVNHLAD